MKDYNVQIKVRNNYLLTCMRRAGFATATELHRASGVANTTIGHYLNLQKPPMRSSGAWSVSVLRLAEVLGCGPDALFPVQHVQTPLSRSKAEIEMDLEQLVSLEDRSLETLAIEGPDAVLEAKEERAAVHDAIATLTPREQRAISLRYGFDGGGERTYEEIGAEWGVSRTRADQILHKAYRKLKHPSRGLVEAPVD